MKFITTILSAFFCLSIQAQLVTYPGTLSTGMPHNDDYTVRVRIPGGEWKDFVRIQRTGRYGQSAGCFHGAI